MSCPTLPYEAGPDDGQKRVVNETSPLLSNPTRKPGRPQRVRFSIYKRYTKLEDVEEGDERAGVGNVGTQRKTNWKELMQQGSKCVLLLGTTVFIGFAAISTSRPGSINLAFGTTAW